MPNDQFSTSASRDGTNRRDGTGSATDRGTDRGTDRDRQTDRDTDSGAGSRRTRGRGDDGRQTEYVVGMQGRRRRTWRLACEKSSIDIGCPVQGKVDQI